MHATHIFSCAIVLLCCSGRTLSICANLFLAARRNPQLPILTTCRCCSGQMSSSCASLCTGRLPAWTSSARIRGPWSPTSSWLAGERMSASTCACMCLYFGFSPRFGMNTSCIPCIKCVRESAVFGIGHYFVYLASNWVYCWVDLVFVGGDFTHLV